MQSKGVKENKNWPLLIYIEVNDIIEYEVCKCTFSIQIFSSPYKTGNNCSQLFPSIFLEDKNMNGLGKKLLAALATAAWGIIANYVSDKISSLGGATDDNPEENQG